ncbi:MAG: hypothetical protein JNM69_31600, partial [Archangium sp.]|nr:hypothetical protein [Archangium sp.]
MNECLTGNGGCDANATCSNTPGSRTCACNSGFTGNGTTCADVNECLTGNGGCSTNATCTNTPGSRTCACNAGYGGNGITCSPNGDTCAAPIDLALNATVSGTTVGAVNDYAGPLSAVCRSTTLPAPDVVYRFTPGATGAYRVTPTASGWGPRVWVGPSCGVASSCVASDPAWSSAAVLPFV